MKNDVLSNETRDRLVKAKQVRDDAFNELDQLVLEARTEGASFREIAEVTGMSVSWVQQALHRADPEQKHYTKRQHSRRT